MNEEHYHSILYMKKLKLKYLKSKKRESEFNPSQLTIISQHLRGYNPSCQGDLPRASSLIPVGPAQL